MPNNARTTHQSLHALATELAELVKAPAHRYAKSGQKLDPQVGAIWLDYEPGGGYQLYRQGIDASVSILSSRYPAKAMERWLEGAIMGAKMLP